MLKIFKIITLLSILGFAFGAVLKIFTVAITHDEAWTIMRYVPLNLTQIVTYPDSWPNNHILNTLLCKLSMGIFGSHDWSARMPSLLGFGIYVYSAYKLLDLELKKSGLLLLLGLILMCSNPYMMDFFSLCRGYALSVGLALLAVYFLTRCWKEANDSFAIYALLSAALSAYANFSSLILWAAVICMLGIYLISFSQAKRGLFIKLLTIGSVFMALILGPILKMRADDQFRFWSKEGFFEDTILSSTEAWRYGAKLFADFNYDFLAYGVVILYATMGISFIILFLAASDKIAFSKKSFCIHFLLLSLTGLINVIQCELLSVPYLSGRTALIYYPLFLLSLLSFLWLVYDQFKISRKAVLISLAVFSLLSLVHYIDRYDKSQVREWWYDKNNKELIEYIKEKNTRARLACNWIFHPSLSYYTDKPENNLITLEPYSKEIIGSSEADYYYIELKDREDLGDNYILEKEFAFDRLLMRKK